MFYIGASTDTAPPITNLGNRWRLSVSSPSRFTSGKRAPVMHRIGGWVDPLAGTDILHTTKISWSYREPENGSSFAQSVA